MSRTTTVRKYGKTTRKQRAEVLFAQLPKTPVKSETGSQSEPKTDPSPVPEPVRKSAEETKAKSSGSVVEVAELLESVALDDTGPEPPSASTPEGPSPDRSCAASDAPLAGVPGTEAANSDDRAPGLAGRSLYDDLCVLTWDDVCPAGSRVEKIAEASYAEVYRVANAHGTSVIKAVRLASPIRAQTKAQARSGLVDEEPHVEDDMLGELRISEWLADVPGFVVYKDRYVVKGKAPAALRETHQAFHRRMKRQDPDRLQFYPSPSRYLDETRFLVVELGDAGTALEDFELRCVSQVWDIFLLTALALARAEDLVEFEHRDLHEGNICIRRVRPPTPRPSGSPRQFGFSGLDITILDYGLSRATNPDFVPHSPTGEAEEAAGPKTNDSAVVAYDLEKDLSLFQSTHAPQCLVYRQMRSYLIHADRLPVLPPHRHTTPYPLTTPFPLPDDDENDDEDEDEDENGDDPTQETTSKTKAARAKEKTTERKPLSWRPHRPYTNVLWLSYLYSFLVAHFAGERRALARFVRATRELRAHLDPAAPRGVLSFPSAGEVVRFAVEAGWVGAEQIVDCNSSASASTSASASASAGFSGSVGGGGRDGDGDLGAGSSSGGVEDGMGDGREDVEGARLLGEGEYHETGEGRRCEAAAPEAMEAGEGAPRRKTRRTARG